MRIFMRRLLTAAYFLLAYLPVPMAAGAYLADHFDVTVLPALIAAAVALLCAYLPARVGEKKAQLPSTVSAAGQGDPDPDRNLRPETLPESASNGIPLRAAASCALLVLGVASFFLPVWNGLPKNLFSRLILACLCALPAVATPSLIHKAIPCPVPFIFLGLGAYLLSGIACAKGVGQGTPLSDCLYWMGLAFLLFTGLWLNEKSLSVGLEKGAPPAPAGVRWRNRALLCLFAAIAALFTRLDLAGRMLRFLGGLIQRLYTWLIHLGHTSEALPEIQGTGMERLENMPYVVHEAPVQWTLGDRILVTLFLLVVAFGLGLGVYLAVRYLRKWIRAFRARKRSLRDNEEEAYHDERVSLMKWNEAAARLNLRAWLARFRPDPAWNTLSPREQVRLTVKKLYRRKGGRVDALPALTAREAIPQMARDSQFLVEIYERARYSQTDISPEDARSARNRYING